MTDDKLRIFTLNLNNQRPDPRGDLLVRDEVIDLGPEIYIDQVDKNYDHEETMAPIAE